MNLLLDLEQEFRILCQWSCPLSW